MLTFHGGHDHISGKMLLKKASTDLQFWWKLGATGDGAICCSDTRTNKRKRKKGRTNVSGIIVTQIRVPHHGLHCNKRFGVLFLGNRGITLKCEEKRISGGYKAGGEAPTSRAFSIALRIY